MKTLSIPKLELQALLLASQLRLEIKKSLKIKTERLYMLPVFVANRVSEVLEYTTIDAWFHVSSGGNPADTGTCGITAEALKESGWVKGPFF